jgi:N6-adenosine-specific RNA methylase IME4
LAPPQGSYDVLVLDPPWPYGERSIPNRPGQAPYASLSLEEIGALPIASLARPDCVLWLWTTNAFLRHAYTLLEGWRFEPRSILTWDKERPGAGDWLRGQTEHCVLASRGNPAINFRNHSTLIREQRREHSRKPEAFYQLVASCCNGTKLEIFARRQRDGWAVWGLGVADSVEADPH